MNLVEAITSIAGLKERIESATVNAKKTAVKGLLARDIGGAIVTGSIFLILGGVAYGLSAYVHPALAAVVTGGLLLTLAIIGILLTTRSATKIPKK